MLVNVDSERFDVEWKLITSTVECIVKDVRNATNTDDFAAELLLQARVNVIHAVPVHAAKVCHAIVRPEGDYFVSQLPNLPSFKKFFPDRLRCLIRDQLHRQLVDQHAFLLVEAPNHYWQHFVGLSVRCVGDQSDEFELLERFHDVALDFWRDYLKKEFPK